MTSAIFTNQNSYTPQIAIKHEVSMYASLKHRIEIAKANQNFQLLSLLEKERQQLKQNTQTTSRSAGNFWDWLFEPVSVLSIEQVASPSGGMIWRGYNSTTGEIHYGESEADMIDWLEQ